MTGNQLDLPRAAAMASRLGQATAVEQSRAVAEVQAQVIVAQRMPRNVDAAVTEMLRSCARKALAEKAFYRFPRAGGQVSGESIVLAKELARCWGNLDYGIAELRRDDVAGESEMMAYAWDLQTNTRPRTTFIVPHVRDKTGGPVRLTEVRDVYENNANMGARRVREMIFNILPPWFIEDAKGACYETLAKDETDGKTIAERAARAVEKFGAIGVRPEQLTQKVGAPQASWSATDLARLTVIFRSIERGESSKEEEFGIAAPVVPDLTAEEPEGRRKRGRHPRGKDAGSGDDVPPPPEPPFEPDGGQQPPKLATPGQVGAIRGHFERLGYQDNDEDNDEDRAGRLRRTAALAGRQSPLETTKELTADEAARVLRQITPITSPQALDDLLESGEVPGHGE